MKEIEKLKSAHEIIGGFIESNEKKNRVIFELQKSLKNLIKICKAPSLTTHGLNQIERAQDLINQIEKELKE